MTIDPSLIMVAIVVLIILFYVLGGMGFFWSRFSVPYVPSKRKAVKKMIEAAEFKGGEIVVDLGCGDGRIVFAAEKAGAKKSIGIEISPFVYLIARFKKLFSRTKNSHILFGNFYKHPEVLSADVLFMFLLPAAMEKFFFDVWPKLKPGTRIISNAFYVEGIPPDKIYTDMGTRSGVYVFIKK